MRGKHIDNQKVIQDETIEEKPSQKSGSNILSIMSRDGIRGPYGMDTSYLEDPQPNKQRKLTSQRYFKLSNICIRTPSKAPPEDKLYTNEAILHSPKMDSAKKKNKLKLISNQSTPLSQRPNYNVMLRNKSQTTAMKRRRKRDPTICRRGVEGMNPYCIVRDESESLNW